MVIGLITRWSFFIKKIKNEKEHAEFVAALAIYGFEFDYQ